MVVHKNKTVDFQCTNILCDDVVLKFDDEKKCTKLSKRYDFKFNLKIVKILAILPTVQQ